MRIATWNVNSVRARLPRLLPWLERERPDVVCLQETKVVDEDFPLAELDVLGYHVACFGQKTYNGVAILSIEPPSDVVRGMPGDAPDAERRVIAATLEGVRVVSVYVPNGKDVAHPAYAAKLAWLSRLRAYLDGAFEPEQDAVLCGDFNIAPEDGDVWDVALWSGQNLFSDPEKERFRDLLAWGLVDTLRLHHPEAGVFTWWDYRQGAFHRGWGLRIDHVLATRRLAARCAAVEVDRAERRGERPSDHAPVVATFG
jgi:exodeoxyribonuclease III